MQEYSSESVPTQKAVTRRAWFWMMIGLVVVGVLFFTMLPVGMDYGIKRYFKDQGADQVNLADVDFNPITGRMTIRGLTVIIGARTALQIQELTINVRWSPFIRKRFVLEQLIISDTELVVEELKDGSWQIGGIILPRQSEAGEQSTWGFSFQEVTINNSRIEFISPRLNSSLDIDHAKIVKLTSWMPQGRTRLELEGKINHAPIQLQADLTPFGNDIMASGSIKIAGFDLNPFSQLLQPQIQSLQGRLDVDLTVETHRKADGGFSHHQKGIVKLYQIQTQIADINLSNQNLAWDGTIQANTPENQDTIEIVADGRLNGSDLKIDMESDTLKMQQDNFSWKGKFDYVQEKTGQKITADGLISLVDTKVASPQFNLSQKELNWQGPVEFSSSPEPVSRKIIADGRLSGSMLMLNIERENLRVQQDNFSWDGKFDYGQDTTSRKIAGDGQISLVDLKLDAPQFTLSQKELNWHGPVEFSTTTDPENQRIIAEGALNSSHLQLNLLNRNLKSEQRGLSWKGHLDSGAANDFSSLKAEAEVGITGIRILHSETKQRLLDANRFDLQDVKIENLNQISIAGIVLDGLVLLAAPGAAQSSAADLSPVRIQEVKLKDVRLLQQNNLAIDTIRMDALKAFVLRDAQGNLPAIEKWNAILGDAFPADQKQQTASATGDKEKSASFGFRIGRIDITAGSEVRFRDESVAPAFETDLSILEANLTDLDNSRPEKPASVKLLVADKEDARLSLEGTMQPFAERIKLDWKGKIEALELPPLSPYVIQSTGYRFTNGELQADIPLQIKQNELDGAIDLILYHPEVKAQGQPSGQTGKIKLSIPLDSALKLLRDKQNDVKLNIPISGNINDPQFSVADAVNKVLAKALQKSALSYLKYMLGPYGIGISVAQFAYEQATKIRLNPILFAPGSDDLDEAAIDYLKRVAAIMKDYPRVQVSVCGVATESDRAAMDQHASSDAALLTLAKNRTESIEDHLVKSNGIEAKRVIACEPELDKASEANPRAKLEI